MDGHELLTWTDRWRQAPVAVEADGSVALSVDPVGATAARPLCGVRSRRRHSRYRPAQAPPVSRSPCWAAQAPISAREWTPSLAITCSTWRIAVRGAITSSRAIWGLE